MARYQGDRAVHAKQLVARTPDHCTLSRRCKRVEVLSHDGVDVIYFTTDGSEPSVAGDNCFALPAAVGTLELDVDNSDLPVIVKLVSAGTPTYSVVGID